MAFSLCEYYNPYDTDLHGQGLGASFKRHIVIIFYHGVLRLLNYFGHVMVSRKSQEKMAVRRCLSQTVALNG